MKQVRFPGFVVLACLAGAWACGPRGNVPGAPTHLEHPSASAAFFVAAVERLADSTTGRVRIDPRPLRADADLAAVSDEDLAADADEATRVRSAVLRSRNVTPTDAVADFRCTFSAGVGAPPGRESALADSVRQRRAQCRAREPYTTLIFGLPERVAEGSHPRDTWSLKAVAITVGGFRIWELYLQPQPDGSWRVTGLESRFVIWS
jgi:hypothetical protein